MLGRPGPKGEAWVRRNHYRLYNEHGFPRRLVTGWAWPRRLVELWIENGGQMPAAKKISGAAVETPAGATDDDDRRRLVEAQHRFLTERIGRRR